MPALKAQDSLGNLKWGCRILYESRDAVFPERMPNFLGNFTQGCLRRGEFPVTPAQ